jgi:mRNA interferase HigB
VALVRIIARSTLVRYAKRSGRSQAAGALYEWYRVVSHATWRTPNEVRSTLGNASIINHERIVFNIAGNKHRLIAAIDYRRQVLFIKFIGTHSEYDRVDAATVDAWE